MQMCVSRNELAPVGGGGGYFRALARLSALGVFGAGGRGRRWCEFGSQGPLGYSKTPAWNEEAK
jgi:hypothetical protein